MKKRKLRLVDEVKGIEKHDDLLEYMEKYFNLDYQVKVESGIRMVDNPFGDYEKTIYDLYVYREVVDEK